MRQWTRLRDLTLSLVLRLETGAVSDKGARVLGVNEDVGAEDEEALINAGSAQLLNLAKLDQFSVVLDQLSLSQPCLELQELLEVVLKGVVKMIINAGLVKLTLTVCFILSLACSAALVTMDKASTALL